MTGAERTNRLGACLAEVRSLRETAEALHGALVSGNSAGVRVLADAQELRIWRIGRLLNAPEEESDGPGQDGAAGIGEGQVLWDRAEVEEALQQELYGLADLSRVNARLLEDGITVSRTLLRMLTGTEEPMRTVWDAGDSRARVFSRQV